jgi:hypothetical protein
VRSIAAWPAGRAVPVALLADAWDVRRNGLESFAERGGVRVGARLTDRQRRQARAAIELYERFAAERPPGWPAAGPAALLAIAAHRLPRRGDAAATFAGGIAVLRGLAKRMRALAQLHDEQRLERARKRARDRLAERLGGGAWYRKPGLPRLETFEQRRRRERDEHLLAGDHPGLYYFDEAERRLDAALNEARRGYPRDDWSGTHGAWDIASAAAAAGRGLAFPTRDGTTDRALRYLNELAAGDWRIDG